MDKTGDVFLQVLLRFLPSLVLFGLAFLAAADRKTREQWANMLYQIGSIRPDQRDNPKVQQGVRLPFLILGGLLLVWPVYHYLYITRPVEVTSTLYKGGAVQPVTNGTPAAVGVPGTDNAANDSATGTSATMGTPSTTPQAQGTPVPTVPTNLYGTPMPP